MSLLEIVYLRALSITVYFPEQLTYNRSMVKQTTSEYNANTRRSIRVKHFMGSAMKSFSLYDNVRSIPAIDGLKPSQRKALYGTLQRGENAPLLQVERLSAHIAAVTDYHHGTGSMSSTIAGMGAYKYAGSNNMCLFKSKGQFGSRLTPDPGAGRYIEARLAPEFRQLMRKEDDAILDYNFSDGDQIEPKLYLPILPLMLINGSSGTGTGHASEIKSYHPEQIRDAVVKLLEGKKLKPGTLVPWFRALGGYKGTVERNAETGQVVMTGKLQVVNSTTIRITELPVGIFLDQYKAHLEKLEEQDIVSDWEDASTEESFDFTVKVPRSTTAQSMDWIMTKFKMITRDTENFTIWNKEGRLQRFESAEAVIEEFVAWRLGFYEIRRQKMITDTKEAIRFQSEVVRFIKFYLANTKVFSGTGKKELIELMQKNGFDDYDRLLGMAIWNLTKDKIDELEKKLTDLKAYLKTLESDTADAMYKRELKAFKYEETV